MLLLRESSNDSGHSKSDAGRARSQTVGLQRDGTWHTRHTCRWWRLVIACPGTAMPWRKRSCGYRPRCAGVRGVQRAPGWVERLDLQRRIIDRLWPRDLVLGGVGSGAALALPGAGGVRAGAVGQRQRYAAPARHARPRPSSGSMTLRSPAISRGRSRWSTRRGARSRHRSQRVMHLPSVVQPSIHPRRGVLVLTGMQKTAAL